MTIKNGSSYINPHRKNRLRYPDCPPLLQDYIDCKLAENLAIRSVNAYYISIRSFLRFIMLQHGLVPDETPFNNISIAGITTEDICGITKKDILNYKIFISGELENKRTTQWHKITCVKSFFRYLHLNDIVPEDPAEKVPGVSMRNQSAKKPVFLEEEQALDLLSAVSGPFEARDRCIITLFLNCGMRLSELTGIDLDDILNEEAPRARF